jgi:hypothetical protein
MQDSMNGVLLLLSSHGYRLSRSASLPYPSAPTLQPEFMPRRGLSRFMMGRMLPPG